MALNKKEWRDVGGERKAWRTGAEESRNLGVSMAAKVTHLQGQAVAGRSCPSKLASLGPMVR